MQVSKTAVLQCAVVCCNVCVSFSVCCSVLQCVVVYCGQSEKRVLMKQCVSRRRLRCSVLQWVAVCRSVLQRVCCSVYLVCRVLRNAIECCSVCVFFSVLQCVILRCSVLQCVAVCCSVLKCMCLGKYLIVPTWSAYKVVTPHKCIKWPYIHKKEPYIHSKEACKTKKSSTYTQKSPT